MVERNEMVLTDNRALFGSRNGNRISVTAVHRLVEKALLILLIIMVLNMF